MFKQHPLLFPAGFMPCGGGGASRKWQFWSCCPLVCCLLTTAPTLRHLIAIYVFQLRRMLFALTGTCCNLVLIVFFIETSAWLNCFPFSCSVVCSIEGHKQCKEEYNAQYRNRVLRQNIWGLVGSFAAHNLPARLCPVSSG